ncbi:NifU family protein [Pseudofrankia sp. BMG5.36]|uniref:NifU family protein n=1 Tax=Pseudofrankia sp. BMG5.36 TaxID=1834512 RepID=UPI000ADA5B1E|nr:NifU family protein [Pseudofrankia sp. BMG5.36]
MDDLPRELATAREPDVAEPSAAEPAPLRLAPAEPAEPVGSRLDDEAVRERLTLLDGLLEQVERTPGPGARVALDAVATLLEVYGEALARAAGYAARAPDVRDALTADELLAHLLVLHGVHPDPVERRARRALEALRPELATVGAEVELLGIDSGVATVAVRGESGCGAAATTDAVADAVRDALQAVAPELSEVRVDVAAKQTLVPVDSLLRGPATLGSAR